MLPAAILVIFVISEHAASPSIEAFERAALAVLGSEARIEVHRVRRDPDDDAAISVANQADGVVELSWSEDRATANLHCYIAAQRRWVTRSIVFGNTDQESERQRMLGFAVASMFAADTLQIPVASDPATHRNLSNAERQNPTASADPKSATHPLEGSTELMPQDPDASSGGRTPASSGSQASTASDVTSGAPHHEAARDLHFAAVASTGIAGEADSIGALAALKDPLMGPLWLRFSLAGRSGELPAAQASTRHVNAGIGMAWSFYDSLIGADHWFDGSLTADLLAGWLEVAHLSPDDPSVVRQSRWQMGMDLVLSGGAEVSGHTLLYAGVGLEFILGKTEIYTHGVKVAVIPPLRLLGELGVRTRF